jgi:hypothetical protein
MSRHSVPWQMLSIARGFRVGEARRRLMTAGFRDTYAQRRFTSAATAPATAATAWAVQITTCRCCGRFAPGGFSVDALTTMDIAESTFRGVRARGSAPTEPLVVDDFLY